MNLLNHNKVYQSVNRGFSIGVSSVESNVLSISKGSYTMYAKDTTNGKVDKRDIIDFESAGGLFNFKHADHKNRHIGGFVTIHFERDNDKSQYITFRLN